MSLSQIHDSFLSSITHIYDKNEAENIWHLIIDNLTGINLKSNNNSNFSPDGCFIDMINQIKRRLQKGEPIQYILNEAWFYDIPFFVNPHVLVPRPETEELVNWVIKETQIHNLTIVDIGTGSGCIPIILKRKIPNAEVISCDISEEALHIAQKNAAKYKTDIQFLHLDFLNSENWKTLPKANIIVSNPPYIPQKEKTTMHNNVVLYEPHQALFVNDEKPLIFYEALAAAGKKILYPGGKIYVEIHENFGSQTVELFEKEGYKTTLKHDMQGKDRFIKASLM